MHVRVDGLVQSKRGEGILQFQLYYINQWLALAFQRLENVGLCDTESVLGTGIRGDEWAPGRK